jgi:hypothetical protein
MSMASLPTLSLYAFMPNKNKSWDSAPSYKIEGAGRGARYENNGDEDEEEVELGAEVTSLAKDACKVKQAVYHFNAENRNTNGRGVHQCVGRGNTTVYRRVDMQTNPTRPLVGNTLLL